MLKSAQQHSLEKENNVTMHLKSRSKAIALFVIMAFLLSVLLFTRISQASEKIVEMKITGCRK